MAFARALRLIRLSTAVKSNPHIPLPELLQSLGISRSQFYKDKLALSRLGFEFRYSRSERAYKVLQDAFVPAGDLTLGERLALVLCVRQMASLDQAVGSEALSGVRKLVAQSSQAEREVLLEALEEAAPAKGYGCDPKVFSLLQMALSEHSRVLIRHDSVREGRVKDWLLDPCALFFRKRALYLDAWCVDLREYRTFRANRIREVHLMPVLVPPRPDYSFSERHAGAFSAFSGRGERRVRVRFGRRTAPFIRESLWHPSQVIEDLSDGGLILQVEVSEPREVAWWALQWGEDAEVLEPEELREELGRTATRLAHTYLGEGVLERDEGSWTPPLWAGKGRAP
jgi:predicted DNA-binding transcriptional regulator YafY